MEILKGLKGYYEKHHKVVYSDSALKAAIHLSERYINDRHLPDKAIDLIDEAGARSKMDGSGKKTTITNKHIEDLLSSILNIPNIGDKADDISQLKQLINPPIKYPTYAAYLTFSASKNFLIW